MKALGIDIGSLSAKAVVLGNDGAILASSLIASSEGAENSAREILADIMQKNGFGSSDGFTIVATGAGGKAVNQSTQKAITTCIARGIHRLLPTARMVIDLGAETSTVIKVNERGRVSDWSGQDKCAAGTGIFVQQMAKIMQMPISEMSTLSLRAKKRADISGTCAVFAESEVISHIHRMPPTPREEIIAGIYASMVSRIMGLCKRIGIERDLAVVGGVAMNKGLIDILEKELGFQVLVPEQPNMVAALGAAILAAENIEKGVK